MATSKRARIAIGSLVLSAAGLVAKVAHEGWAPVATLPTQGDVPTVCYGMTQRPDGTPVKLGDKCMPVEGLQRTLAYTAKAGDKLRECVKVPLHQEEFDLLDDHAYQYGVGSTCNSPMVRSLNVGDYVGACAGYLQYKRAGGYDCSTLVNGQHNKRCWGVWERSLGRYNKCMAVQ
jgi:lysozyme